MREDDRPWTGSQATYDEEQLLGINAWHRTRRSVHEKLGDPSSRVAREAGLDLRRRLDVLRRQHESLLAHSAARLGPCPGEGSPVRCVIAHAHDWSRRRITQELERAGADVVLSCANAADAVGASLGEQPDVVLVGDRLAMMSALEVVRDLRCFVPASRVVVQARSSGDAGVLADAGASNVLPPRLSPAEVAAQVLRFARACPATVVVTA